MFIDFSLAACIYLQIVFTTLFGCVMFIIVFECSKKLTVIVFTTHYIMDCASYRIAKNKMRTIAYAEIEEETVVT